MSRTLSEAAIESTNAQETAEVWLTLVEIDHADLTAPIRVVNNHEDITSNSNLFQGFPFNVEFPDEPMDGQPMARLSIDGVDRTIVETLRTISSPPTVKLQVILASQPDTIEVEFDGLTLRRATYPAHTISGDLVFQDILSEPITFTMTPNKFPGLFG